MVTRTIAAIIVGTLYLAAGPALASACKTSGAAGAKEIAIDIKDHDTLSGLHVGFQLSLDAAADIVKVAPCSRGSIKVGGDNFDVGGENADTPPRYATGAAAVAYLAVIPRPAVAWAWAKKYQADNATPQNFSGPNDTMYALTVARGDDRFVYAYLDKIRPDERLKQYLRDPFPENSGSKPAST